MQANSLHYKFFYFCLSESGKCGKEGKKLRKFEHFENEKSFLHEIKIFFFFIVFRGLSFGEKINSGHKL